MIVPPEPADERERLVELERFRLGNIGEEEAFEEVARLAADVLDMPSAFVTIIGAETQRCAGAFGMEAGEIPRRFAFCGHTILGEAPLVVTDARQDSRFANNPHVTGPPHIRFYAGAPLTVGGRRIGSLCVVDHVPRTVSETELRRLRRLGRVCEMLIEKRLGGLLKEEAETRLAQIVDATPVAIAVYDRADRFLLSNEEYRSIFFADAQGGLQPGTPFTDHLTRMMAAGARPVEGPTAWARQRRDLPSDHPPRHFVVRIGSDRWFDGQEVRLESGELVSAFSDVTELKRREAALSAQTDLLRRTFESIEDGIAVFDRARTMVACSDAYFDLFDVPAELRRLGTPLETIVRDLANRGYLGTGRPQEIAGKLLQESERKSSARYEVRTPEGRILAIGRSVVADGRAMITCQDVTERREVDRLKNEFVSNVSHELRTPLTSITGSLGLLAGGVGGELSAAAARLVQIAHQNVERLSRLVNDLLDIDKIESGEVQFQRNRIDLADLLDQAVEQNRPYADRFGILLALERSPEPLPVDGDPDRLLQLATNLISNAVKYSPPGATVSLATKRSRTHVWFSVADSGPGIPEEFRPQLFRRFAQADSSDRRAQQGTGLGLPISQAIAERHEGTIEVESEIGVGTTFSVKLPLAETLPQTGSAPNVLVCQDDRTVGTMLRRLLQGGGVRADLVGTLAGAEAALRDERYDALVLDVLLPDGNALDWIRTLRSRPDGRDLPIIIVAAFADEAQQTLEARRLDVVDWMDKPVDLARLTTAIDRYRAGADQRVSVLHVEDEPNLARVVALGLSGFADVALAQDLQAARSRLADRSFDVAILDLGLPDGSGAELLPDLAGHPGGPVPVIIFSGAEVPDEVSGHAAIALEKSRTSIDYLADTVRTMVQRTRRTA